MNPVPQQSKNQSNQKKKRKKKKKKNNNNDNNNDNNNNNNNNNQENTATQSRKRRRADSNEESEHKERDKQIISSKRRLAVVRPVHRFHLENATLSKDVIDDTILPLFISSAPSGAQMNNDTRRRDLRAILKQCGQSMFRIYSIEQTSFMSPLKMLNGDSVSSKLIQEKIEKLMPHLLKFRHSNVVNGDRAGASWTQVLHIVDEGDDFAKNLHLVLKKMGKLLARTGACANACIVMQNYSSGNTFNITNKHVCVCVCVYHRVVCSHRRRSTTSATLHHSHPFRDFCRLTGLRTHLL